MILNVKLNETTQKMMWTDAIHAYERVINSMANMSSTKSPFKIFHGEKPKIIGSFQEFERIAYITKREKFQNQITYKTYKAIMARYAENHIRDMYKWYNTDTKRVIKTRDVKWSQWKMINPAEILKIFCDAHEEDLVPCIEEDNIPTSKP